jgi:hypothetical protein
MEMKTLKSISEDIVNKKTAVAKTIQNIALKVLVANIQKYMNEPEKIR